MLLKKLQQEHCYYFKVLNKSLDSNAQRYVTDVLCQPEDAEEFVAAIDDVRVPKQLIRQFSAARPIYEGCLNHFIDLLIKRENMVIDANIAMNLSTAEFQPIKRNIYLPTHFFTSITGLFNMDTIRLNYNSLRHSWNDVNLILITVQRCGDNFDILLLDPNEKIIHFINPRIKTLTQEHVELLLQYETILNKFIPLFFVDNGNHTWRCSMYRKLNYQTLQNNYDCGIYTMLILYMFTVYCPLVIRTDDIPFFRLKLAYYIMKQSIPF